MGFVRKPWFFIPALIPLALGLYAMAGYWLAPRLIRSEATAFVDEALGKSLALGEIRVDPFRFTLDVHDLAIGEKGHDRPMVALDHLFADLEGSSLWERSWNLSQVRVEGPYLDARIRPDGSLNLADLVPRSEGPDTSLPSARLQALTVSGGRIDFADHSRRLEPTKTLSPIDFTLKDFRTTAEGGGFRLATASEEGERLEWSGHLSLQPLESDGRFTVTGLRADSVYAFFSDALPMQLTAGSFDLGGDYRFEVAPGTGMQLEAHLPEIRADALALRARDVEDDWVTIPEAVLQGTRLSLREQHVGIDSMRVRGLAASLWREADGRLNIERLLAPPDTRSGPAAPSGDDWTLDLDAVAIEAGDVRFEDRMVSPAGPCRSSWRRP